MEDIAVPGESLGVIEEFTPGTGVYEELGVVYSSLVGAVIKDMAERRVSVRPLKNTLLLPKKGDIVVGVVTNVKKDLAEVDIYQVEGGKTFTSPFKALMHVSRVSTRYVDKITSVLWPGDIIRAKILVAKDPYILSMKERGLGVLLAFCSKCRAPLILRGNKLTCLMCGSSETRRVSSNYMLHSGRIEARLIKGLL